MNGYNSWQNKCTSVRSRFEYLLENSLATDVEFFIGPEKFLFRGHKIMFYIASSVFYDKFIGIKCLKVEFPDTTVEAFRSLMQYLYTEKYIGDDTNIFDLFKFAEEFKIKQLRVSTIGYMIKRLKSENNNKFFLKNLINFPEIWQLPELFELFLIAVSVGPLDIFNVENIKVLQKKHVKMILENQNCKQPETEIFNFAICWVKSIVSECKADMKPRELHLLFRDLLGPFIYLIRFPSLTIEEFRSITQKYDGLLTTDEVFDIVAYISNPKSKVTGFSTIRRGTPLAKTATAVSSIGNIKIKSVETLRGVTVQTTTKNVSATQSVKSSTSTSQTQSHVSAKLKSTCSESLLKKASPSKSVRLSTESNKALQQKITNLVDLATNKVTIVSSSSPQPTTSTTSVALPTYSLTTNPAVANVAATNQRLLNNKRGRPSIASSDAKKVKCETKFYVRKCKQPQKDL